MTMMSAELSALSKVVVEKFNASFEYFEKRYALKRMAVIAYYMRMRKWKLTIWTLQTIAILLWYEFQSYTTATIAITLFSIGMILSMVNYIFTVRLRNAIRNAIEHTRLNTAIEISQETAKSFLEIDSKYLPWL